MTVSDKNHHINNFPDKNSPKCVSLPHIFAIFKPNLIRLRRG
jgi:hypothetical protein